MSLYLASHKQFYQQTFTPKFLFTSDPSMFSQPIILMQLFQQRNIFGGDSIFGECWEVPLGLHRNNDSVFTQLYDKKSQFDPNTEKILSYTYIVCEVCCLIIQVAQNLLRIVFKRKDNITVVLWIEM